MSTPTWLVTVTALGTTVLLAAAPTLLSTGCAQLECAEGTQEENGVCVPADSDPSAANCGDGTVLGDDGTCVVEDPTVCGENTIADTDSMPGTTVCIGMGGPTSCESSLACPSASPNKVSVCGRFYDIETDTQIRAATPNIMNCGEGGATDGPCSLSLKFYDAIDFAGNPSTAAPLVPEELRVDDCGRYVARNISRPSLGFLGIGVDDAAGAAGTGDWELTGVAFPVASQQVRNGQKTYVLGASTNADWSADVGFPADNTFVDRGVYMAVFLHGAVPVAGVTVTGANGAARPADDYYFTDDVPLIRSEVTASGPTGLNGAAMLLNSGLVEHSGTGNEPSGCRWPSALAASVAGLMFFNPRIAEVNATTECP